jgi:hypothetical protein
MENFATELFKVEDAADFFRELRCFAELINQSSRKEMMPLTESGIKKFNSLPTAKKQAIKTDFSVYSNLIYSASKYDLRDEERLLGHAGRRLGLIFSENLFDYIQSGDIIEIYNMEFKQIYRNLALFDICSYSLIELLSYEFYELYERSAQVNDFIIKGVHELLNRPFSLDPIPLDHIPRHLMREKFSVEKVTSHIEFKWLFPIYKWPNEFAGVLCTQRATPTKELPLNVQFL